jgi:hypothetical protein
MHIKETLLDSLLGQEDIPTNAKRLYSLSLSAVVKYMEGPIEDGSTSVGNMDGSRGNRQGHHKTLYTNLSALIIQLWENRASFLEE